MSYSILAPPSKPLFDIGMGNEEKPVRDILTACGGAHDFEVEFIAHAGFAVKTNLAQILIDPWFTASSFQQPIIKSLVPSHQTIDYLIPEPIHSGKDFQPDVVLISHFHAHHSSSSDFKSLAERSDHLILACPELAPARLKALEENLGELASKVEIIALRPLQSFKVANAEVVCLPHTSQEHVSWMVSSQGLSFVHLSDAPINKNWWDRRIDAVFEPLRNLNPHILALGCGGHTSREMRGGQPIIHENAAMGPYEAARLAQFIGARSAGVMGMFNFSIWKNRYESMMPAEIVESQFRWAFKHLSPQSQSLVFRPGCEFRIATHATRGTRIQAEFS